MMKNGFKRTTAAILAALVLVSAGSSLTVFADEQEDATPSSNNETENSQSEGKVAQIGETTYDTLQAAINASKSGDTITLLADIDNSVGTEGYNGGLNFSLKTNTTLNGDGHKISGHVAVYIPSGGATVQNICFENIHNNATIDQDTLDYYKITAKTGNQSAIYAQGLTGTATITGCTFDNIDWDAIQITPLASSSIIIENNIFRHTDKNVSQLRYIHIQHTETFVSVKLSELTITDNQFYKTKNTDCETASIGIWKISKSTSKINISGNYLEDRKTTEVSSVGTDKLYPMRSQPTVDEDDVYPTAYYGDSVYLTLQEAIDDTSVSTVYLMKDNAETITIPEGCTKKIYPQTYKMTGSITNNGTLSISTGTNTGGTASIINNGTLSLSCNAATGYTVKNNGVLNITSGATYDLTKITNEGNGSVVISGGTFATEPSEEFLAKWYVAAKQNDESYKVSKMTIAAAQAVGLAASSQNSRSGNYYTSVAEAVNDTNSNAYLQKDCNEDIVFSTDSHRFLYLNGYVFTGSIQMGENFNYVSLYGSSANLTNVDGKELRVGDYQTAAAVTIQNASLETLDVGASGDCKIMGGVYQNVITRTYYKSGEDTPTATSKLSITGGTFTSNQVTVVYVNHKLEDGTASEQVSLSNYVSGGYDVVENKDGTYTVCNHTINTEKLKSDETGHWYACDCGKESQEVAEHTSDSGTVTKAATTTSTGVRTYTCTACGYVIKEETIPVIYVAPTTTTTTTTTPTVTTNEDGSTTTTTTKTEGNVTTSTATNKDADGNVTGSTETKEEKKSDGSTVTTETKKDADGKVTQKTETTVAKDTTTNTTTETTKTENADGTKTTETVKTVDENNNVLTETTKETEVDKEAEQQKEVLTEKKEDGSVVKTTTTSSTNADDLSKTIVEEKAAENSKGSTVEQTTITVVDTTGKTTSVTEEHKIDNVGNSTNAVITVEKDGDGNVQEATAEVEKTGATKEDGLQATFTNKVVSQLKEAAGDAAQDLTITMTVKDENGDDHHSITAKVDDLTPNNTLYIYKQDENGNYIMVNAKEYTTDAKGQLKTTIKSKSDFVLLNEQEANAATKAVLSTVKASKTTASVKKSKTTTMKLDSGLNMANVKNITYKTSKSSVATVDKKTGKITAKKAGKATVSAVVTLKNGTKKTVKMTINVK